MMDRIKEIAALLDECGIKYELHDCGVMVRFDMDYCENCSDYLRSIVVAGGCVSAEKYYLTPEEAVDAMTERGTCHIVKTEHKREISQKYSGYGEMWYTVTTHDCDECGFENFDGGIRYCGGCGRRVI